MRWLGRRRRAGGGLRWRGRATGRQRDGRLAVSLSAAHAGAHAKHTIASDCGELLSHPNAPRATATGDA